MLSPAIHLLFVEAMQPGAAELDRRQPGDDHDLGRVVSDGFPLMAADELAEEQVVAEEEDTKIAADHRVGDLGSPLALADGDLVIPPSREPRVTGAWRCRNLARSVDLGEELPRDRLVGVAYDTKPWYSASVAAPKAGGVEVVGVRLGPCMCAV